jgi:amidase
VVKGRSIRGPQLDTGREFVCVGLGDPVQDAVAMAYESLFSVLVDERGWAPTTPTS